ncbi:FAS1-like dehydratase domain-containing protein [Microbacterium rhizomatis]|uniref:MaoC family dehydratase n=1 Tax=Microbacterium rhizomatis TaxID=1631477 RepID=A0A5J5IXE7_9MICO|nr:MaoC family dehydratase N-terminal domain-containing protein [Microbacterium rhizomatis]KAA9105904.1 MaoC family dehydratase [Microbacterium rhizomatis]
MTSAVSAEMAAAIGSVYLRDQSYPVSASDIRRWAIAVHWPDGPPARFLSRTVEKLVAPEEFNPFAWAVASRSPDPEEFGLREDEMIAADCQERLLGISPPAMSTGLFGAYSVSYGVPICEGDSIASQSSLRGYSERESRRGLLLTTTLEDRWINQRGEFVKSVVREIVRY